MTDHVSSEDGQEQIAITVDEQTAEVSKSSRRLLHAALGTVALIGDKVGAFVEGTLGPTFDRLIERGESLERNSLGSITRPAQQSLDAATDAGRQASRLATSTASTVATETKKQVTVASGSLLEALSKQVDALRESVDELRKNLPQSEETSDNGS